MHTREQVPTSAAPGESHVCGVVAAAVASMHRGLRTLALATATLATAARPLCRGGIE
jgi:hypothetical protein